MDAWVRTVNILGCVASVLMIVLSWTHAIPLNITEAFGFVTGGISVWLAAQNNIWNWPIGIVNGVFYLIVFWNAALYADASLQIFFIVTNVWGWYWWVRGGADKTEAPVTSMRTFKKETSFVNTNRIAVSLYLRIETMVVTFLTILGVLCIWPLLRHVGDVAPFWDAVITTMSVAATYLMGKRYIECWYVWITVDVISIILYADKHLPFTSLLYIIYLTMCVWGFIKWRRESRAPKTTVPRVEAMA